MAEERLDGILVQTVENVGYLTGIFLKGLWCFITAQELYLFAPPLAYEETVYYLSGHAFLNKIKVRAMTEKEEKTLFSGCRSLGVELELPTQTFVKLNGLLPKGKVRPGNHLLKIRRRKSASEIVLLRKACRFARDVFHSVKRLITTGMREEVVADILRRSLERKGAQEAFTPICAAGIRSSFPHALITKNKIGVSDWVVVDFGARYRQYSSDLTRTIFPGKIDKKAAEIYRVLAEAKRAAEKEAGPGVATSRVDRVARKVLEKKGLARYFLHGLGHGVGLSVHEEPVLSQKGRDRLEPGMVITLEPAVYIPGWGGLRLEDTYLVTSGGLKNLTL